MRTGIVIPKGWTSNSPSYKLSHLNPHPYNINYQQDDLFYANNFSTRYSLYPPQSLPLNLASDFNNATYSTLDYTFGHPIYITSQCSNILQRTNRPLVSSSVKVLSYNIYNGNAASLNALTEYLHDLVNDGLLMATLVEANQWDTLTSAVDMVKNVHSIIEKASRMGLAYSYVAHSRVFNNYPVGIVSAIPFHVLDVQGSPAFERGYVYVHYSSLDLYVVALHLHAHNATVRSGEVRQIVRRVLKPLLDEGRKVLVMGDFNTLSPVDRM
ncbi:hypothetical protein EON63_08055 [archaeon]|nr:MAG: hypothetical protein EON63_08055 [archaeon]